MENTQTNDLALAPPAQNSENTNNPLLAVASSEIVLPVRHKTLKERVWDWALLVVLAIGVIDVLLKYTVQKQGISQFLLEACLVSAVLWTGLVLILAAKLLSNAWGLLSQSRLARRAFDTFRRRQ